MRAKLSLFVAALLALGTARLWSQTTHAVANSSQPEVQTGRVDPITGLPIGANQGASDTRWKDTQWVDPKPVLTNVVFDDIPLSEVAKRMREQFADQFDVILPSSDSVSTVAGGEQLTTGWQRDWNTEQIQLHLRNVTASEIFAAMNLFFENDRTPLRWELKVDGHHQIALLRVLVDPSFPTPPDRDPLRRVYFVGDLIGDNGGMSMEEIIKTITDVWQMANVSGGTIQFHKEAQLLVVSGTPSQMDFMEQTLRALEQKVKLDRIEKARAGSNPNGANAGGPQPKRSGN